MPSDPGAVSDLEAVRTGLEEVNQKALRRLSSWRSLGQWGRGLLKRCPDSDSSYAIVIPVSEVKRQR